ncbi:MAG: MFS transporter [Spirochaetes bacterium]|nr:MFS transporter [Spirochaetota bacterium]
MYTKKSLLIIFTINQIIHWFIIGIFIPIMSLFQLQKGLNLLQIGMTCAIWAATIILLELPTGGLSDTIGRKKVYLLSMFMNFISVITLLFAFNFWTIGLGIAFLAASRALSSGSLDAWFVDEFNKVGHPDNLQKALAKVNIFVPIALGVSNLLGGIIPSTIGQFASKNQYLDIYSSNFLVMGLLILAQVLFTSVFIKETLHPHQQQGVVAGFKKVPEIVKISIKYGLSSPVIFYLLLSGVGFAMGMVSLEQYWQPQVKQIMTINFQPWILGVIAALGCISMGTIGSALSIPLCKKFKNNYPLILFFNYMITGFVFIILAFQTNIAGFIILYLTLFSSWGFSSSPLMALFNHHVPEDKRSTLLSFQSLSQQLGVLISGFFMGYLSQFHSISFAWLIGATIIGLSSLCFLKILNKLKTAELGNDFYQA